MTTEEVSPVLVVTAHPDDADFSSAGTVAKWVAEGRDVIYVLCTSGDKGSDDPNMTSERLAATREQEQRNAGKVLGLKDVIFLRYPDGGVEETPEFRGQIVKLIRTYRPGIVVTQDPFRWQHRDHRTVGRVALDACFPYARDIFHYPEHIKEGLSTHKVAEVYLIGSTEADTQIDVTDYLETRMKAARCHVSQIRDPGAFEERWRKRLEEAKEKNEGRITESFKKVTFRV